MVPNFNKAGNLPPGIHLATWLEIEERFSWNEHRKKLFSGLFNAIIQLKKAGCRKIYIDGSFVTKKEIPNDYDVAWDPTNVNPAKLDPTFLTFKNKRIAQKIKYLGEFFPISIVDKNGDTFLDFFQIDKNTGDKKGIIMIDLDQFGGE